MNGWFWAAIIIVVGLAAYAGGFVHGVKAGWAWREETSQKPKN